MVDGLLMCESESNVASFSIARQCQLWYKGLKCSTARIRLLRDRFEANVYSCTFSLEMSACVVACRFLWSFYCILWYNIKDFYGENWRNPSASTMSSAIAVYLGILCCFITTQKELRLFYLEHCLFSLPFPNKKFTTIHLHIPFYLSIPSHSLSSLVTPA